MYTYNAKYIKDTVYTNTLKVWGYVLVIHYF